MMTRIERLSVAILIAVALAMATFLVAFAQAETPTMPQPQPDCAVCHAEQTLHWQGGAHGQASANFRAEWTAQGQPGACLTCHFSGYDPISATWQAEGIACTECHSPVPANHPTENMPVNQNSDLCGRCHSNAAFSQGQWHLSAHYQRNMTCSACHDPHTTGPRLAESANGDLSALCLNCHKNYMQDFPASIHAQAGVTCVACHLGQPIVKDGTFATAHTAPDHDFLPSVQTCSKCHATQMHAPGAAGGASPKDADVTLTTQTDQAVSNAAAPVSPMGFAGIAIIIGMAAGMVLAPWLEPVYRRITHGDKK